MKLSHTTLIYSRLRLKWHDQNILTEFFKIVRISFKNRISRDIRKGEWPAGLEMNSMRGLDPIKVIESKKSIYLGKESIWSKIFKLTRD